MSIDTRTGPDLGSAQQTPVLPALPASRVWAFLIDLAVVLTPGATAFAITSSLPLLIVMVLEIAITITLWESRTGTTPGNLLIGLRSARQENLLAPGLQRVSVRATLIGTLQLVTLVLPLVLLVLTDRQGRAWPDRVCGTRVLTLRRAQESVEAASSQPPAPASTGKHRAGSRAGLDRAAATRAAQEHVHSHGFVPSAPTENSVSIAQFRQSQPESTATRFSTLVDSTRMRSPHDPVKLARLTFPDGFVVHVTDTTVLGRRPDGPAEEGEVVQVPDASRSMSRAHAQLRLVDSVVYLMDLGSMNGTSLWLGEVQIDRLRPHQEVVVPAGAVIRFGHAMATVEMQ
ncbi:MAG: RDD family protein [Beutenbergiaceae bacterium]